ncbi:hypothetical protein BCV70DRAFT_223360 [Testicularia cyperi]|uniref:Uncharacterized protein n=1 Tax=Testicularia cyperi TaxID=1882483 RepID=A0A317XPR8_9BASI|nr:hypothetical protein BCV70DRAFT_223360 [Testicularia cyperi]
MQLPTTISCTLWCFVLVFIRASVSSAPLRKRAWLNPNEVSPEQLLAHVDDFDDFVQENFEPQARPYVHGLMRGFVETRRTNFLDSFSNLDGFSNFQKATPQQAYDLGRLAAPIDGVPAGIPRPDFDHLSLHYLGRSADRRLVFRAPAPGSYIYVPHHAYRFSSQEAVPYERLLNLRDRGGRSFAHMNGFYPEKGVGGGSVENVAIKLNDDTYLLADQIPLRRMGYSHDQFDPVYLNGGEPGGVTRLKPPIQMT